MWKRVVAPVVVVSVLWVAVSIATTYLIHWMYQTQERALTKNLATVQAVGSMQEVLARLEATLAEAGQGRDRSRSYARVAALEALFDEHRIMADGTCVTAEEQVQSARIRQRFAAYMARTHEWLRQPGAGGKPPTIALEDLALLSQAVADPCKTLLEINTRLAANASEWNWRMANMMTLVRLGFVISGPAIGIILGLWLARGIRRSITQISVTLGGAAGELEHEVGHVDLIATDDFPALQEQVQAIAGRIRQVMDQLQQARRETMRADRLAAVGELAAGVAHEIRNPLTSVKLLIQSAAQRNPEHVLSERQLEVVLDEIARIEKTVQGLLDFARPPRLRPVCHDLCDTVRRSLSLVEGRAKQQLVAVADQYPDGPVMLTGDPEQLRQVFVNLLLNGIESMPDGGQLSVAVEEDRQQTGVCRITICDLGTGIAPAVMERLFEPFVTGREHGTGLGLAISRRIVRQHGGAISAVNRPEGGAEFTVELPLDPTAESDRSSGKYSSVRLLPDQDNHVAPVVGG